MGSLVSDLHKQTLLDEVCTVEGEPALRLEDLRDFLTAIRPPERPPEHRKATFYENGQRDVITEIIETIEEEL